MTTQSAIPEYLDWCPMCHADGYFKRTDAKQNLWKVCCSQCSHETLATGVNEASQMWNSKIVSGVEHAAISENIPFERDVARRTGIEVFRFKHDKAKGKARRYGGD